MLFRFKVTYFVYIVYFQLQLPVRSDRDMVQIPEDTWTQKRTHYY